jgi:hypothetical protein
MKETKNYSNTAFNDLNDAQLANLYYQIVYNYEDTPRDADRQNCINYYAENNQNEDLDAFDYYDNDAYDCLHLMDVFKAYKQYLFNRVMESVAKEWRKYADDNKAAFIDFYKKYKNQFKVANLNLDGLYPDDWNGKFEHDEYKVD